MREFWQYLKQILRYRGLIAVGMAASLLDAACKFTGVAALMYVFDQLVKDDITVREMILNQLADPDVRAWVPAFVPDLVTTYVPAGQFSGFVFVVVVILALTILGSFMRFTHQYALGMALMRMMLRIRLTIFNRLIHISCQDILAAGAADVMSRVSGDVEALGRGARVLLGKAVRDTLGGIAMLILAVILDWKLTLIFLIAFPVMAYLVRMLGRKMRRVTRRAMEEGARVLGVLQESLQNLHIVKLHQAEGYERRRYHKVLRTLLRQQMRGVKLAAIGPPMVEFFSLISVMSISLLSAWYIFNRGEDPATLLKVMAALAAAGASFRPLSGLNGELQVAAAGATRVAEMMTLQEEERRGRRIPRHHSSVEFDNVVYHFAGKDVPAVDHVSLKIRQGTTVAIVGPNGAGKTTLLMLLPRLIEPTSGRVLIDGVDIRTVGLRSLRKQMAMVTQHSAMFRGTIAENIAYGRPGTPRHLIEQAAQAAFAHDFIEAMPDGYDTKLGDFGSGLSGGQRQRLCIARAILRDPAILVLDEATSQIDADSEDKINEAMRRFAEGRTTFIIAHRLSTVVSADMIIVMEHGKIVGQGTHAELLKTCSMYQILSRTQLVARDDDLAAADMAL